MFWTRGVCPRQRFVIRSASFFSNFEKKKHTHSLQNQFLDTPNCQTDFDGIYEPEW